jgi:hypothetical protein
VLNRGSDTPENRDDAEKILRRTGCARIKFAINPATGGLICTGYAS